MLARLTLDDLDLCADTVARLGGDQPRSIWASLAWVIRNRIECAAAAFGTPPEIGSACNDVLMEALATPRSQPVSAHLSDLDWCRLRAVNHLVWAGDLSDETGGAIACHRHDRSPLWAKARTPTALLGSFLFFR
ncbi:MAG: hypothetical protein WBP94_02470 [Rhodomicrobiaceae bacterium]